MTHPRFADLFELDEPARIEILGTTAEAGAEVAFIVDDEGKANRYMQKLRDGGYKIREVTRCGGPRGTVIVRIGPKAN